MSGTARDAVPVDGDIMQTVEQIVHLAHRALTARDGQDVRLLQSGTRGERESENEQDTGHAYAHDLTAPRARPQGELTKTMTYPQPANDRTAGRDYGYLGTCCASSCMRNAVCSTRIRRCVDAGVPG